MANVSTARQLRPKESSDARTATQVEGKKNMYFSFWAELAL